jgi:hypothetical protein
MNFLKLEMYVLTRRSLGPGGEPVVVNLEGWGGRTKK